MPRIGGFVVVRLLGFIWLSWGLCSFWIAVYMGCCGLFWVERAWLFIRKRNVMLCRSPC